MFPLFLKHMFDIILKRKEGTNVLKGIKLRLYPNRTQQNQLEQMFGNDRFVWNQMLAMMNERYQNNKALPFLGKFKLNYLLKPLKKEYPFLKTSDSSSLQVVNEFLTQSWKNFFQDKSGQIGKPRFHSRKYLKKSYTGYVKTSKTGVLQNTKIKRYTVLLEPTGKYYLSLQVEISEPEKYSLTGKRVGIDVGVADLAILSNGLKYPSFDSSYFEKKAKIWQKKYSRRRHLVKLLVLQDRNKKVLCPRSLESFTNWQ
ncbi:RNA-guided endonuclease TnpB family protein, partial [Lactobacillus helveticus]|uniref:RNA-guided endonuclease TnpB family protein n=1 Tax=Lactobacillus helveticus TaxID=1587 RepID=UPI001C20D9FB